MVLCHVFTSVCTGLISICDLDICDVLSDQQIKSACDGLPYDVEVVRVDNLRLGFPDLFRWRIDVECDGCSLGLKQKAMPEVCSSSTLINRKAQITGSQSALFGNAVC